MLFNFVQQLPEEGGNLGSHSLQLLANFPLFAQDAAQGTAQVVVEEVEVLLGTWVQRSAKRASSSAAWRRERSNSETK